MRSASRWIWPVLVVALSAQGLAGNDYWSKQKRPASDDDEEAPPPVPPDAGPVLTQPEIVATLQKRREEIQSCYEAELPKNRSLAGHVVVQFTILATGAVSGLSVKESTLHSPSVERCILRVAGAIVFSPKPSSPITLAYGWTFGVTPSKGAKAQ